MCEILGFGLEIKELEKKNRSETMKMREKERKIEGIEQRGLVDAIDAIFGTIFDERSLLFASQERWVLVTLNPLVESEAHTKIDLPFYL